MGFILKNYLSSNSLKRVKFVSLCLIFFLLTFCYDILHTSKLSLVLSQKTRGEIIPFLKFWGIMPSTIIMTTVFAAMTRIMNMERVFYAMMSIFIAFFLLFIFLLFPYKEYFTLSDSGLLWLRDFTPEGWSAFLEMIKYWHFSLFYLFAELWGNIILNMLFWGFVNEITAFVDAKKDYSLFIFGANIAPMFAGAYCLLFKKSHWLNSLNLFVGTVVVASVIILALFYLLNRIIEYENERNPSLTTEPIKKIKSTPKEESSNKKNKSGFTLLECIRAVSKSRYLACITIVVLCYYMIYNLTDVIWTDQLAKRFAGDSSLISQYQNKVSIVKGCLATILALFVSGNIIRKFGWFSAAVITPGVLALTSGVFFPLILSGELEFSDVLASFVSVPLIHVIVFIGAAQHCMVRAAKYTIFDATKEMAFIPLSRKEQRMGKAVVDGLGARIGKAAGAVLIFTLLWLLKGGGLAAAIPYLAVLTLLLVILWIYCIWLLKKELEAKLGRPV